MKAHLFKILLCVLVGSSLDSHAADLSATPPAGYVKITAQGGSDTLLSLPLVQRTAWMGKVTAVTVNHVTLATAETVMSGDATPSSAGWYYAEFVTGDLAGLAYPVLSNDAGVFELETWGDDLTAHGMGAIAAGELGDIVRIRQGWTLAGIFGVGSDLVISSSPAFTGSVYLSGDEILIPDNSQIGTEKKPAGVFAYVEGEGWRERAGGNLDASAHELYPWEPLIIRRGSTVSAEVVLLGYTTVGPRVLRVPALSSGAENDFAVLWGIPIGETLLASALSTVLNSTEDPLTPADLLLDYSSLRRGFARPPEHMFELINGHWFEANVNQDDFILVPGTGYILRLRGERPVRYWRQNFSE